MTARKDLQTMMKHLSNYRVPPIAQTAMQYLALNQELAKIKPNGCPCCEGFHA